MTDAEMTPDMFKPPTKAVLEAHSRRLQVDLIVSLASWARNCKHCQKYQSLLRSRQVPNVPVCVILP